MITEKDAAEAYQPRRDRLSIFDTLTRPFRPPSQIQGGAT